jgi:membrane associated rhomboid family serine protease
MAETLRCYRHPDRETGVSCSECGRGICPDCMRFAPVGIRCPDHAGEKRGAARVVQRAQSQSIRSPGWVAKALVGVNVGIYLLQLAQGAPFNANGGSIYIDGLLFGPAVADGDWWRLITAAFLHYGPVHLAMNMVVLWWFGPALEEALGSSRFLLLYLASGLAGSAGVLLVSPNAFTVGASGAIYGLLGAILVLERQGTYVFGGSVIPLLVINFAITFFIPGISIGGHVGGFVGGALAILVLSRFGRQRVVNAARADVAGYAGIAAVGLASVVVAFWQVGLV